MAKTVVLRRMNATHLIGTAEMALEREISLALTHGKDSVQLLSFVVGAAVLEHMLR